MNRVLKPGGLLIMITPLNFEHSDHWSVFFPAEKLRHYITDLGLDCLQLNEEMIIQEPLDIRGNCVLWKCLGIVAKKITNTSDFYF